MTEITPVAPNRVSLTQIIELGVQKTYHDLTVLAELLPRKTDFERKVEIVNFAERTRQLFIRLLALVKWAGGASKIEQCMDIVSFLDKQALLFINTADNMANIARTTLVQARLPPFQLPCAVEVLTLGTYSRMPTCVRDRIVPPDPISLRDKRATLARLDHIIEQRLSTSAIHPAMRNLKISHGRVTFHVENEFDLKLTVMGDDPNLPWTVLKLDLLVEDADTGEGKELVHPMHLRDMELMIQQKMKESQGPLVDIFGRLHNFCLSLQIEVLFDQAERLVRERLASFMKIKEHIPGQELAITYWGSKCVLKIHIDLSDAGRSLKLAHQPELVLDNSYLDRDRESIFKPGHVSIEQLLTETIQKRAFIKLSQLASELQEKKYGKCTISGVPSLLHVCCLDPCASSEELIISIDLNGSYLAHVPQYEKACPLADNIQESLNSNKSKLGTYFDQLKIWLTKKRCIRTIDYLSVTATESLPLCSKSNHAKLDDKVPRLFFQFNKHNNYYLMTEFFTLESNPYSLDARYSLLVTEPIPKVTGDGLDTVETDNSIESVRRDLLVVENILKLNAADIIASSHSHEQSKPAYIGVGAGKDYSLKSLNSPPRETKIHPFGQAGFKPPVSLISDLPILVSFCEEKLAHLALDKELRNRNLNFEISHPATSGHANSITFGQVPTHKTSGYSNALKKDTSVMIVCLHEKPQSSKIWHCSYIFKNCPIATQSTKEQSPRRFVFTPYESSLLNVAMVSKFIDDTQLDWACMAHLYDVVVTFSRDIRRYPRLLDNVVLKSFNYKKLVLAYGPQRRYSVALLCKPDRKFHLIFGVIGGPPFGVNPHSFMSTHFKHEFNQHKSIKTLVNQLNATLQPLAILHELPVYPFFGLASARPNTPATSFCLMPLSSSRLKLIWRNWHAVDIKIQPDSSLIVRDGAYSRFDRKKTVEDLVPIHHFDNLLSKRYVATSYCLNIQEFSDIFRLSRLEQHFGMSFMIRNIHKKLTPPTGRALTPPQDTTVISFASDIMQYRFSMDLSRKTVQMKATPLMIEDWRQEEIEIFEHYFETRIAAYPFKADPFASFYRLFNFPKTVLRDFIQILRMELLADRLDQNILWNIALPCLIPPGTPFMTPSGMSSVCPLKTVLLFVVELTRRGSNKGSVVPTIYLPLSYEHSQNMLVVYIPPRSEPTVQNSLPHLFVIDGHLRQFCEQFRSSGNQGCVIYPAIRHLLTIPNFMNTNYS